MRVVQKKNQRLLEPISRFPLDYVGPYPPPPPRCSGSEGSPSSFHLGGGEGAGTRRLFPRHFFRALTAPYVSLQQNRARLKVLNLLSSKSQYPVKQAPILFLIFFGERMQAHGEIQPQVKGIFLVLLHWCKSHLSQLLHARLALFPACMKNKKNVPIPRANAPQFNVLDKVTEWMDFF